MDIQGTLVRLIPPLGERHPASLDSPESTKFGQSRLTPASTRTIDQGGNPLAGALRMRCFYAQWGIPDRGRPGAYDLRAAS
jgi:hypothetical protein